jgi:hypothetical protein
VDRILPPAELASRSKNSLMRWRTPHRQNRRRETMLLLSTPSTSFFPTGLIHHTLSPLKKVTSPCLQTKAEIVLPLRSIMPILMLKYLLYLIRCRSPWFKHRILLRRSILPYGLIRLVLCQAMLLPVYSSILRLLSRLVHCSRYLLQPLLTLALRSHPSARLHLWQQNIPCVHSTVCHHGKLLHTNFLPRPSYSWQQAACCSCLPFSFYSNYTYDLGGVHIPHPPFRSFRMLFHIESWETNHLCSAAKKDYRLNQ